MPARSPLRTATAVGLMVVILAAPLALGGTRIPIKLIGAGLAGLALMGVLLTRKHDAPRLPWPLWAPVLLIAWYGLALIPLPEGLLSTVSPLAAQIREGGGPWSLDPAATGVGVALQAGFAAVAIAAACLDATRQRWLLIGLTGLGAGVALIGLVHWGMGTERIFGVFAPRHRAGMIGYFSTFVNNNTLAGLTVLTTGVALGLLARTRNAALRLFALAAALLSMLATVLSGSRGGQLALVAVAVIFAALSHWRPTGDDDRTRRTRAVAHIAVGLTVLGFIAAVFALPDWQQTAFERPTDDLKIAAWGPAVDYARDVWLTGSGRDTFTFVYPRYQAVAVSQTISHPENIVLQLACEGGVIAVLLGIGGGLAALGYLLGDLRRGSPIDLGIIAGLVAVSLQQLVDFGFESAGLAFPVAAALGVGLARAARRRGVEGHARAARAALVGGGLLAVGILIVGPRLPGLQADAELAAWRAAPGPVEALRQRHPADGLLPIVVADRAARAGDLNAALPWINRALRAAPTDPRPHLIAARLFVTAGREGQAASEYRRAYAKAPWIAANVAREAARLKAPQHLLGAVPPTGPARQHLATALLAADRAAALHAAMDEALLFDPDDASARRARARACLAQNDLPCLTRDTAWLMDHDDPALAHALRARSAARRGDAAAADAALAALGPLASRNPEALALTARVMLRLKRRAPAQAAIDQLRDRLRVTPARLADAEALQARLHRRFAEPPQALDAAVRAYGLDPSPQRALEAAQAAIAAGRNGEARRLLTLARQRWPRAHTLRAALDALAP